MDYPWDPDTWIWDFQWRLRYQVTARRQFLWRIGWEEDHKRNTLTHDFLVQERVHNGDLSIRKVPTAKNSADVGTKPVTASVLQQHCKFAGLVFYWPWIPHSTTRCPGIAQLLNRADVGGAEQKQKHTLVKIGVNIEMGAELSETIGTSHDEWIGRKRGRRQKERSKQRATSDRVNTEWSHLGDCLEEPTTARWRIWRICTYLRTWLCSYTSSWRTGWIGWESVDRFHALDWLDKNQLADFKSSKRVTLCKVWTCLLFEKCVGERRSSWRNQRSDSLLVLPRFAHESCIKVAVTVRGGVLKFTFVVDSDATLHGVQTDTVAFSPSVTKICSYLQSLTRTWHDWLKKRTHDKQSHVIIIIFFRVMK